MKKLLIFTSLCLFSLQSIYSQKVKNIGTEVIVYLKDGSAISGKQQSWDYGKSIQIVSKGMELTFPASDIQRVVEQSKQVKNRTPIVHVNEGFYYTAKAQFMAGNEGNRAHHRVGWGGTASAGYQWNQYIMTGIGTGYREFIWDTSEEMIPVFMEVGGFFANTNVRPFYNLQLGYSFALKNEELGLTNATGGLLVYPAIGISMGRNRLKTTVDLGYNFQKAEFTYGNNFDDRIRSEQQITFRRLSLRVGVSF